MNEDTRHWLEACRRATARLVQAADAGDEMAVEKAIAWRQHALDTLRQVSDGRLDAVALSRLHVGAEEAETALVRFREEIRQELRRVVRGAKAIGGYAVTPTDASSLDRSG